MIISRLSRLILLAVLGSIAGAEARGESSTCPDFQEKSGPSCALAYFTRAQAHAAKGDDEHALKDFNMALSAGEGPLQDKRILMWALYSRGLILLKRNHIEEALDDFNRALHANPLLKEAYLTKAEALLRKKNFPEALEAVNRALWVAPFYRAGFSMRARVHLALGRTADALLDNAQAGALFAEKRSLLKSYHSLYNFSTGVCSESDKHLIEIRIAAGTIEVRQRYVGSDAKTLMNRDEDGIILRVGGEGCRLDIRVGKGSNEGSDKSPRLANVELSIGNESIAFSQVVYKQPSPACADTKLTLRAYWGFVEIEDDYDPSRGQGRVLGLMRVYGNEGCELLLRIARVD